MLHRAKSEQVVAHAIAAALQTLPRYGFQVERGVPLAEGGQVGLVLESGSRRIPVEVKPFKLWQPESAPAKKALWQVNRDQVYLSAARGVLWLPCAAGGLLERWSGVRVGLVLIAFGSVRSLARVARRGLR